MKPMLKAIRYGVIDAWLSVRRFFAMLMGSYMRFDTEPGKVVIDIVYESTRKTFRIATHSLDASIAYIDRQPHGAPVVFKERDRWLLVPGFFVVELREHLVQARDALNRSRNSTEVSGVVPSDPVVNTRSNSKSVN